MEQGLEASVEDTIRVEEKPRSEVSKKLFCFIIMPFSDINYIANDGNSKTLTKTELTYIYEKYIKYSVESYRSGGVSIIAERYKDGSGNFVKGIVNKIYTADLVIADLTGMNPNVFYELGIRHTLKNNTIMITQSVDNIPSDLKNYISIEYNYTQDPPRIDSYIAEFEKKIHEVIKERLEKKWDESDNPVRDFIEIRREFTNEKRISELKSFINILSLFRNNIIGIIGSVKISIDKWRGGDYLIPLPYVDTEWTSLYYSLMQNEKDIKYGIYLKILINNLNVINNNIQIFKNILRKKGNADQISLHLVDSNKTAIQIYEIQDPNNNIIVNSINNIIEDMDRELKELLK